MLGQLSSNYVGLVHFKSGYISIGHVISYDCLCQVSHILDVRTVCSRKGQGMPS